MEPDDLYGLPLDRFVAERSALAKTRRADGRRAQAADVAAMRKPSVAAWAVNQLVRTQSRSMQELFDAGDGLRDAHADVLAGRGDGRALRAAGEGERASVERLVEAARGLLTSQGQELSPSVIERVSDTLHAAALDEDAREQVREGRLERELRHVGLGFGESTSAPPARPARASAPAPATKSKPRGKGSASGKPTASAADRREQRAEAERTKREQAAARTAARTAEAAARRRAERAAHALHAAEERRERAARALDEADTALADARDEADDAAEAQRHAQADLESTSDLESS